MNLAAPLLLAAAAAAALPAQAKPPTARQFLLDDYTTVVHLDMKAVRDTGVWDEMGASTLRVVCNFLDDQFGFSLDQLDRITSVQAPRVENGQVVATNEVVVVEGNDDLGEIADPGHNRYAELAIGAYTLRTDQWMENEAYVQVTPKLRVHGSPGLLTPVLTGKPRTGLPSPDVMAFTAGKKQLLFYAISDLRQPASMRKLVEEALPDAGWPQDDKPTFVCLSILASGDPDDPHLTAELVLRHGAAGPGLAASEKAVTAALERLAKLPQARAVWPLLKKVAHESDGSDALYRVDLGRARHVGGMLATMSPFLLFASSQEMQAAPAMQVQVLEEVTEEVEEPPPPPPPEKKKDSGN
ncbi:MAG: hypothetical protein H6838_13265 [Planctomycetes bacterium]|nr:hypothetical protein [Planctomycetota bacterium]MCB9886459.1 hypothetical protein [Planctomycetota bacterium]